MPAPDRLAEISWTNKQSINTDTLFSPWQPGACQDNASYLRNAGLTMSARVGARTLVRSFSAHGPYVLYQFAANTKANDACHAVLSTTIKQQQSIDQFVPTPTADMADLPEDPSGELWARTVWRSDDESPLSAGIWQRNAWLHFAGRPNDTSALLADAGVDWVSQRLTRVYRARDDQIAARFMDKAVGDVASASAVRPTAEGVPGLPGAKCFVRTDWVANPESTFELTAVQLLGRVKCFATTGRYMFTSMSDQEKDAKQQITAQYRILAGQ